MSKSLKIFRIATLLLTVAISIWFYIQIQRAPSLILPVLFAAAPLAFPQQRGAHIIALILLGIFCILGIFSVGLFYLPSWILMAVTIAISFRKEANPSAVEGK